jgi:hypothetical protein
MNIADSPTNNILLVLFPVSIAIEKNSMVKNGIIILNISVSKYPGNVLIKYMGAVTTKIPVTKPAYSPAYLRTKTYPKIPANGPIIEGIQKEMSLRGILTNKFTKKKENVVSQTMSGGYSAGLPGGE